MRADGSTYDDYAYYAGVDELHSVQAGGTGPIYLYSLDSRHNVNGLLSTTGGVVKRYRYVLFGKLESVTGPLADAVNERRFAGPPQDDETGLYYMRARYTTRTSPASSAKTRLGSPAASIPTPMSETIQSMNSVRLATLQGVDVTLHGGGLMAETLIGQQNEQ